MISPLTNPTPGISVLFANQDLFCTVVPPSEVRAFTGTTIQSQVFSSILTGSSGPRVRVKVFPLALSSRTSPTFQVL